MSKAARFSSQLGAYFVALTAADALYSAIQFSLLILHNIPVWGGFPTDIVASDVVVTVLMFVIQWPVILLLSVLPFLAALLIQRSSGTISLAAFLMTGGLIGGFCSAAMCVLYFRNAADDPDAFDLVFYATHTGTIAIVAGIVGAYVYRRLALPGSAVAS